MNVDDDSKVDESRASKAEDDGFITGHKDDEFEESFEENDEPSDAEEEEEQEENDDETGILALIDATSTEMQSVHQEGMALISGFSSKKRATASNVTSDEIALSDDDSSFDSVAQPLVKRGRTKAD